MKLIINKKAKAVPVLKGSPKVLTKNKSMELDRFKTKGKRTLKIKPKIIIEIILATIKPRVVGLYFLK